MTIATLQINDFRNLTHVILSPCEAGLNILSGENGSGKTSLLEAIYYMGHGRSFRNATLDTLIRENQPHFSLFIQTHGQPTASLGASKDRNGVTQFRLSEKNINSISKFAQFLPIRVINSDIHELFEAGPLCRRQYLDWGLFYQNQHFMQSWREFDKTLKQRNSVLREKRSKSEWETWTKAFVEQSLIFHRARIDYIASLEPILLKTVSQLLSLPDLTLNYCPGWEKEENLSDILHRSYHDEMRIGHTQFGPHRADLDLMINGVSAKYVLSRGQQKLMGCAMILAQGIQASAQLNRGLIYLVDDLPSELDEASKRKLISLLLDQSTQVFITTIESDLILKCIEGNRSNVNLKMFHVEHGQVSEGLWKPVTSV